MIRVFENDETLDCPWPENQRVAVKPNLTYPHWKHGVTTSPAALERVVAELARRGNRVFVVESDGGYGAWLCEQAFEGHGIYDICRRHGAEAVNLTKSEWTHLDVGSGGRRIELPFPRMLLEEIDAFITMPVPKVHCMTGVSLGMKNQWGCVPDPLRLNFHYRFNEAILKINRSLPSPSVIADGTYFLDDNGPMEGQPVRRDLMIQADTIGEFERYTCAMMGVDPQGIRHLAHAIRDGFVPGDLDSLEFDRAQLSRLSYKAKLNRTPRNWMVLTFFHSKFLTRLIYTSTFGRILHHAFYAVVGKPTLSK
jgi:uncharacterized protein (DUF362 family)